MKKTVKEHMCVELKGQRACFIPVTKGINKITFQVSEGKIRVNHGQFTPDGGTWLDRPTGRLAHYNLGVETKTIEVDIRESYNHLDRIQVVNPSFIHIARFMYYFE